MAWHSHGVVTRQELLDAGIGVDEIVGRLEKGALQQVYCGVYRVGHAAPSLEASLAAAVKACGEGALLSGLAAAHLYSLTRGRAPKPEVTAPTERDVKGVLTHRARSGIDKNDVTTYRRIPITTVPRTLVDIAGRLTDEELARACHEAAIKYRTTPAQVEAVLERRPRTKGAKRLRAVLRGDTPVLLSKLEKRFMKLLKAHDLPLPKTNRRVGSHLIDCRWPEHNLTVELDSYAFHNTRFAWQSDRRRDREARRRGERILRYIWDDLDEPATVEELKALLSPARAAPS